MATITLKYDARNAIARKTIDYILSLGVFKTKEKISGLDETFLDVKDERVHKAKIVEENVKNEKNLTAAQEKEAFFYTSKINAAKAFSKHL